MSETNKKEAGVQEETEKDLPETEPVTEPVEESPEATAGTETTEETESAAEDDKESDKETKGKNSFFGKKKKDNKLEQQIEDLTDRLKRNMAEFDNFRKRTEKEKSSMYVIGAKDIIEKILPVVDNFERGLAQAPEDDPFAAVSYTHLDVYKRQIVVRSGYVEMCWKSSRPTILTGQFVWNSLEMRLIELQK